MGDFGFSLPEDISSYTYLASQSATCRLFSSLPNSLDHVLIYKENFEQCLSGLLSPNSWHCIPTSTNKLSTNRGRDLCISMRNIGVMDEVLTQYKNHRLLFAANKEAELALGRKIVIPKYQ